jgi:WD40 repeat protein/energy-coupling factor transporter ATP-binding protein EcfA2
MAQNENLVVSTVDVNNPFPGLRPFKIEESHLFFGREGQSDEVLLKLSKSRFVGVIGPSGSGKSSFIYCGVLPILYGGFLTDASPNWEVIVTRPGAGPIDNLSESLLRATKEYQEADGEDKKIKRTIVSTLLRSSSLGLVEAIQQSRRSEDINYLILVDQFEELFRFKDSTDPNSVDETLAFVNLLMEAVNYTDSNIYVAITMRSDFIGDCAQFPDLTRKINDSHYLIPQMTRDQKRRAVEGPVAVGGAKIAPRLVQQLLNDLGDNPDQLPILQHALMRTWSYWSRYKDYDDESVDLKHYEAIGTMREALSQHANEAFDELDDEQKRICESLFKAITEKRGENFGIRRPTRLNEIAAIADVSEEDVISVLEKFREPGRSLLTPAYGTPLGSRAMIDISHESLMRIWTRLKNWVDDEAEAVQMYLRLAEAAAQYQVGKAGLWRPPDLQLALNWQTKHKPTLVWGQRYHPAFERTLIFLEYSKKEFETEQRIKELEQKRKLRNARIFAIVLGTATVISLLFLVYALVQRTQAIRQREIAVELQKKAEENEKKAIVAEAEAKKQAEIARQQAEIARQQKAIAEENEKLADLARADAVKNATEAKRQEGIALKNADAARKAQTLAEKNEKEAKNQEMKAQAERYRAIAKAMAIKSKELGINPEQEAVVAQQAHNFNVKYAGYKYDNDIYNGLFRALANNNDPMTKSLEGHLKGAARALETRVNSNHIYSGGSDGRIIRWTQDPEQTWKGEQIVGGRTDYLVFSLDISPDEKLLAAGGSFPMNRNANYVELYDMKNIAAAPKKITGFVSDINDIHFTNDNTGFYARDNSGHSIKYSDLNTAKEVIAVKEKINYLEISPDGKKLVGAGNEGNLYIWDIGNNYQQTVYSIDNSAGQNKGLTAAAYTPDGRRIIVGNVRGLLRIVDTGIVVRELSGHTSAIEHIKFNFAGTFMATASKDFSIRLWEFNKPGVPPMVLSDHDWVWGVAFTPNDDQLMAGINSVKEEIGTSGDMKSNQTIHAWPTNISSMSDKLCNYSKRNMTKEEWDLYVSDDLPYVKTCATYPDNYK